MQRSDEGKCVHVEGRTLFRLRTLIGWWWDRCLFFDDCRHHKLISLTRELASPRVSLPYSAKCAPVFLSIEELLGVRKRPHCLLQILLRANLNVLAEPLQGFFPICKPLARLCSTTVPGSKRTHELNRNLAHHLQRHIELFRLLDGAA